MNDVAEQQQARQKNAWLADLTLEFSLTAAGTQLTRTKRLGPLNVQKPFYPKGRDCAHIYLLHPPAGIVSGDDLTVNIAIKPKAHVLVTTPGANRFYRAREDISIGDPKQQQKVILHLDEQAKCENFPLETIVYEGADGVNTVDIYLSETSTYLGWDITCLGLPSSHQLFAKGSYSQLNRVYCQQTLLYHDRIAIRPDNQIHQHIAGLNQHNVFGTFLAYASAEKVDSTASEQLITRLRVLVSNNKAEHKISISQLRQLLVIRYLGEQAQECQKLFVQLWQELRPIYLDKSATLPRIWHT